MSFFLSICICGGGPSGGEYDHYIGGSLWQDPGAFANGFQGVCSVFVTAAFAFSGTELVGLAASETPNPRDTMPGISFVSIPFWFSLMSIYRCCEGHVLAYCKVFSP